MLGCDFLEGNMHPLLCSHRPFSISRGMSSCCGVWWSQFWVRRSPEEEALVELEGGHRGDFHLGSPEESTACLRYRTFPPARLLIPLQPPGNAQCSELGEGDQVVPLSLAASSGSGGDPTLTSALGPDSRVPSAPTLAVTPGGQWLVIRSLWEAHDPALPAACEPMLGNFLHSLHLETKGY